MNQKGYTPITVIVVVLLVGGLVGGLLYNKNKGSNNPLIIPPTPTPSSQVTPTPSPTKTSTNKIVTKTPTPTAKTSPTLTPTPAPLPKVTCTINTQASSGWSPVWISFSYSSSDQGRVAGQEWDLDGNGTWESENSSTDWTYKDVGNYEAKLRLKLSDGNYSETCSKTITVNPPKVTCSINTNVTSGSAPLAINFSYGASFNGTGDDYVTDVQWDFNGDGTWDTPYDYSSQNPPVYTFSAPGNYTAKMHLKTKQGTETDICTKNITVN